MALTLEQAKQLTPGTKLTFGTEQVFTVMTVEPGRNTILIGLMRDDDFPTFANEHMLNKASVVSTPAPAQEWVEPIPSIRETPKSQQKPRKNRKS